MGAFRAEQHAAFTHDEQQQQRAQHQPDGTLPTQHGYDRLQSWLDDAVDSKHGRHDPTQPGSSDGPAEQHGQHPEHEPDAVSEPQPQSANAIPQQSQPDECSGLDGIQSAELPGHGRQRSADPAAAVQPYVEHAAAAVAPPHTQCYYLAAQLQQHAAVWSGKPDAAAVYATEPKPQLSVQPAVPPATA